MTILFVLTSYNNVNEIEKCLVNLNEIKKSNFNIYKILLIDDCSSDGTLNVANKFKCIDKIIKKNKNQGVSHSRNIGINFAIENDFLSLLFVDADDYLNPEYFKTNKAVEKADIFFTNYKILINNTALISVNFEFNPGIINLATYIKNYCLAPNTNNLFSTCWAKIFSTSFLKNNSIKFNEDLKICEDTDFMFNCLSRTKNIHFDPNFFYTHTISKINKNRATLGVKLNIKENFQFIYIINNLINVLKIYRNDLEIKHIRAFFINYSVIYSIRAALKIKSFIHLIEYYNILKCHYSKRITMKSIKHYNYGFINTIIMKFCVNYKYYHLLTIYLIIKSIVRYKI
jgi:glycosyltransferase involved in cell wall biosynthesis